MLQAIEGDLLQLANPEQALFLQRYFKTGPGQYGAGDLFRGIRVPALRKLALARRALPLEQARVLLQSDYHEDRLLALLILVLRFQRGVEEREEIYRSYLDNTRYINNWDLVDCSAQHIVGAYLWGREEEQDVLQRLALSPALWERRIAVMATFHYLRRGRCAPTLALAELLLKDPEDLIHKAVGWMLREVGKRDPAAEEAFLLPRYRQMPRTMLRYAIERFPEEKRLGYLKGTVTAEGGVTP